MFRKIARAVHTFHSPATCAGRGTVLLKSIRNAVFAASLHVGAGGLAQAHTNPPYYPFRNFIVTTAVTRMTAAAIVNPSSAGLVFSLPWSIVQPNCGAFTFSTDGKDILGYLAANLRADQMIWPGIGGGTNAPACLTKFRIPTAKIWYSFGNNTNQPCVKFVMPLMSDPTYGRHYVAAVHAMLLALAEIPVASGGTLADRVAGIDLAAYAAVTSELEIPSRGCSEGSVHQSAAYQTHLWVEAGYQGSQAISTYAAILQAIFTDPALPPDAKMLQNTTGADGWSFPQPYDALKVLRPIFTAATLAWGNRYVISWNLVSDTGALPPATIVWAAESGVPVALEFNSTAVGSTTSCHGIRHNGRLDPITATPACFHAMQPRNRDAIPTPLVFWQVEPADFSVRGFFR
jgi:hypothetical protein